MTRNDEHCCFICEQPFRAGEMVLQDVTEGLGHRACFGDDREGYVHLDTGASWAACAPLPTGFPYDPAEFADPSPTEREVSSERVSEERLERILDNARHEFLAADTQVMCQYWQDRIDIYTELLALRSSVKTVGVADLLSLERYHQMTDGWGDEVIGLKQHPAGDYVKWRDVLKVCQSISAIGAPAAEGEVDEKDNKLWRAGTAMKGTDPALIHPDDKGHRTRFSDSSFHDEVCVLCGATDGRGDNRLERQCPKAPAAASEVTIDVDALAQEIRRVDGRHDLGAGQLAEALLPFLTAALKGDRP